MYLLLILRNHISPELWFSVRSLPALLLAFIMFVLTGIMLPCGQLPCAELGERFSEDRNGWKWIQGSLKPRQAARQRCSANQFWGKLKSIAVSVAQTAQCGLRAHFPILSQRGGLAVFCSSLPLNFTHKNNYTRGLVVKHSSLH